MSKYLLILFLFFMPFFFLGVELCYFFFFSFLFTPSFFFFFSFHAFLFFFFWGCAVLLFSVLDIFLFLSGGAPNLFFVFLVSFPCFLFSGALCFLSLSLDRLNKPLRNRFLLVLSRFSDRFRGTMVTQSKTISWTICPSSGTKYDYVA